MAATATWNPMGSVPTTAQPYSPAATAHAPAASPPPMNGYGGQQQPAPSAWPIAASQTPAPGYASAAYAPASASAASAPNTTYPSQTPSYPGQTAIPYTTQATYAPAPSGGPQISNDLAHAMRVEVQSNQIQLAKQAAARLYEDKRASLEHLFGQLNMSEEKQRNDTQLAFHKLQAEWEERQKLAAADAEARVQNMQAHDEQVRREREAFKAQKVNELNQYATQLGSELQTLSAGASSEFASFVRTAAPIAATVMSAPQAAAAAGNSLLAGAAQALASVTAPIHSAASSALASLGGASSSAMPPASAAANAHGPFYAAGRSNAAPPFTIPASWSSDRRWNTSLYTRLPVLEAYCAIMLEADPMLIHTSLFDQLIRWLQQKYPSFKLPDWVAYSVPYYDPDWERKYTALVPFVRPHLALQQPAPAAAAAATTYPSTFAATGGGGGAAAPYTNTPLLSTGMLAHGGSASPSMPAPAPAGTPTASAVPSSAFTSTTMPPQAAAIPAATPTMLSNGMVVMQPTTAMASVPVHAYPQPFGAPGAPSPHPYYGGYAYPLGHAGAAPNTNFAYPTGGYNTQQYPPSSSSGSSHHAHRHHRRSSHDAERTYSDTRTATRTRADHHQRHHRTRDATRTLSDSRTATPTRTAGHAHRSHRRHSDRSAGTNTRDERTNDRSSTAYTKTETPTRRHRRHGSDRGRHSSYGPGYPVNNGPGATGYGQGHWQPSAAGQASSPYAGGYASAAPAPAPATSSPRYQFSSDSAHALHS